MNIFEAVKLATEKGYGITQPNTEGYECYGIVPTNSLECCLMVNTADKIKVSGRWCPDLDDLLSEKWDLTSATREEMMQYSPRWYRPDYPLPQSLDQ